MAGHLSRQTGGLRPFFRRDLFDSLREEMDELMNRFLSDWDVTEATREYAPALDLVETENALEIRMEVPGVKPEDIDIEVTHDTLHIRGERKLETEEQGKTYHRIERRTGTFSRSILLPTEIQEDNVSAEYHDGILVITLPKAEHAKSRRVTVKGGGAAT